MSFLKSRMKIQISCSQCRAEGLTSSGSLKEVEFREDGRYELQCSNGHKTVTVLDADRYELLFDLGAYAIEDGYYREAVNSFSGSLERFYEFFIKAVLLDKKSGKDFAKVFTQFWKQIGNSSERQLGAFIMLYTKEFEKPPVILSNDRVKFRNEVVHKGRIPTREEALDYGQAVTDIIRPVLKQIKEKWSDGKVKALLHNMIKSRRPEDSDKSFTTLGIMTILSPIIAEPAHNERSLEEALAVLKAYGRVLTKLKPPK